MADSSNIIITTTTTMSTLGSCLNRYFQLLIQYLGHRLGYQIKKIEYIKDLSTKVIERKLDVSILHKLSDEEIIAQLIQVKGIGRWTAEMFLIFCLGRLDVLPVTDLDIRKAMQKTYSLSELPKPTEMLSIAQPRGILHFSGFVWHH
jgi:3-methyladenine DNA glycosylase/8-oxoguanine DNA glycosylase